VTEGRFEIKTSGRYTYEMGRALAASDDRRDRRLWNEWYAFCAKLACEAAFSADTDAAGLSRLFIDASLALPEWLHFRTFDDLKHKLVGVVIVVLAVLFLGFVVSGTDAGELLSIGAAIAMVIAALSYFLSTMKGGKH
jgi:hypothetical protein